MCAPLHVQIAITVTRVQMSVQYDITNAQPARDLFTLSALPATFLMLHLPQFLVNVFATITFLIPTTTLKR